LPDGSSTTAGFVGGLKNLPIYDKLKALGLALVALEPNKAVTNAEVAKAIEDAFGKKPANLLKDNDLDAPIAALRDSLIAIKLLPEEHRRQIEALTNQFKDLEAAPLTPPRVIGITYYSLGASK
jgi:hypothetical protein